MKNFLSRFLKKEGNVTNLPPFSRRDRNPVSEMSLVELMGKTVEIEDNVYVPVNIRAYTNRYIFTFQKFDHSKGLNTRYQYERKTVPYNQGDDAVLVVIDGYELFWDIYDECFRWLPDESQCQNKKLNPWVEYYENKIIRIEKSYAEHNLTQGALEYAYQCKEGYYYWNADDCSYAPVEFEIPRVFYEMGDNPPEKILSKMFLNVKGKLSFANKYCDNYPADKAIQIFKENYYKKLWEPEKQPDLLD